MANHRLPVLDCTGCVAPCCTRQLVVEVAFDELNENLQVRSPLIADPRVYILERRSNGACIHLTPENRCAIYAHRPRACRDFDCRDDERFGPDDCGPAWIGHRPAASSER